MRDMESQNYNRIFIEEGILDEEGSILLFTQIVMFAVVVFSLICLLVMPLEMRMAKSYAKGNQACYLAEAGVAEGLQHLWKDRKWQPPKEPILLGEGYYQTEIKEIVLGRSLQVAGWVGEQEDERIKRYITVDIQLWDRADEDSSEYQPAFIVKDYCYKGACKDMR